MPDNRLAKTRRSLPEGYQHQPWRRPSDNAAERLKRQSGFTANVIEGDHFDTDCDPGDENEPRPRRLRRREA